MNLMLQKWTHQGLFFSKLVSKHVKFTRWILIQTKHSPSRIWIFYARFQQLHNSSHHIILSSQILNIIGHHILLRSNLAEWIVESVGAGEVPGGVAGGRVAVVPEHAVLVNTTVRLSWIVDSTNYTNIFRPPITWVPHKVRNWFL